MNQKERREYIEKYTRLEQLFIQKLEPYGCYRIVRNNDEDHFLIDLKLIAKTSAGIFDLAWLDLEARGNDLSEFNTIHVPKKATESQRDRGKSTFYFNHQKTSFHISWNMGHGWGYLVRADGITPSDIVKVYDSKTQREVFCFDVPILRCKRATLKSLTKETALWWQKGREEDLKNSF